MSVILGGAAIVVVLALIVFPDFRKGLKSLAGGFLSIWLKDVAKTPEGAKAIYQQKIDELQKEYNRISTLLNQAAGELTEKIRERERIGREITKAENQAAALVQAGRINDARIFTEQRATLIAEAESLDEIIERLKVATNNAKATHEMYAKKLVEMKAEAKKTVSEMELNAHMSSLLAELDDLRADSATDKLVNAVREGAADIRKEATGSMVVHQNRLSTKIAQAQVSASAAQSDAYLQSLVNKYQPKQALPGASTGTVINIDSKTRNYATEERK